jgi:hypothetical protein
MSKKSKNKLKKQRAQILQEASIKDDAAISQIFPSRTLASIKKEQIEQHLEKDDFLPEIHQVKHDLKRIGIIVACLFILLIAAVVAEEKAGIVDKAAGFILKGLDI